MEYDLLSLDYEAYTSALLPTWEACPQIVGSGRENKKGNQTLILSLLVLLTSWP